MIIKWSKKPKFYKNILNSPQKPLEKSNSMLYDFRIGFIWLQRLYLTIRNHYQVFEKIFLMEIVNDSLIYHMDQFCTQM